jgi:hypothetical protein
VEKGPGRVVSESCATIGEVKLCLCRGERQVVIIVEWVRVGRRNFSRANYVDLVDKSGEILGQGGESVRCGVNRRVGYTCFIERLLEVPDGFISS